MSKRRVLSDEQCRIIAQWFDSIRTVRAKAKELGVSESAIYDAVTRIKSAPRETPQSEAIENG